MASLLLPNREESLHMTTSQKIKDMIVRGNMKPGDKLPTEKEMIQRFGVSRSTLREALKVLKAENVITQKRGSGTYVSYETGIGEDPLGLHFTDQKNLLNNLLETRILIEPEIVELATYRATEEDMAEMKKTVEEMERMKVNTGLTEEMDVKFHTCVAKCTHNDVLIRVLPIIVESIRRGHSKTAEDLESFQRAKKRHREIYEAIAARDYMKAKFFTERHIWETKQDIETKEEKT
ncbi:MAG: FadR/GntR family transcriptional regulator [Oribacterium sp.]|nr:FadR/GntR family transcriptional regulator [Oribacterium sp.]MDD6789596.1 FadR/GntR family transcriptional regulator [Lachnospira sp.]